MARDSEDDRVPGLAAEVAFFALLSVFPGLLGVAAGLGALDKVFGSELAGQAQRDVVTVLETSLALLTHVDHAAAFLAVRSWGSLSSIGPAASMTRARAASAESPASQRKAR
jgi:uncharacterized BrkB/YihY/UPF0761 family membrane protein